MEISLIQDLYGLYGCDQDKLEKANEILSRKFHMTQAYRSDNFMYEGCRIESYFGARSLGNFFKFFLGKIKKKYLPGFLLCSLFSRAYGMNGSTKSHEGYAKLRGLGIPTKTSVVCYVNVKMESRIHVIYSFHFFSTVNTCS